MTQQKPEKSATGEALKIVNFVSSSLFVEEEVALGDGVTLKLSGNPKLDKISLAMWISANCQILRQLTKDTPDFHVEANLQYTEMTRKLATRFTWQSVLLFDEDYWQKQEKSLFYWGTDAPHLSTVMLWDCAQLLAMTRKGAAGTGSGQP